MANQKYRRHVYQWEGKAYRFNYDAFNRQITLLARNLHGEQRGKMEYIIEQLSKKIGRDPTTIHDWRIKRTAPSKLKIIEDIADFFGVKLDSLLTPLETPIEKAELEEDMMCEIKDYERDAARRLYAEMCDMIDGLEYIPDQFASPDNIRCMIQYPIPWVYRDDLILNVRKASFDLPKQTRDQLIDFIFEAFGDGCYERGMMYFESQAYEDYLEKNGLENNDDTRDLYSVLYIKGLYEKLDAIFVDYLQA